MAAMGIEARCAAHRPLNLPMAVLTDPVAPRAALTAMAREMAGQGAEAIVLGCAGMAAHRAVVEQAAGVPVIEPCQAAAALAIQAVIATRPSLAEAAE
jgi:Asp/Glu/hydantoin racemase